MPSTCYTVSAMGADDPRSGPAPGTQLDSKFQLIGKLGEDVVFVGPEKANAAYQEVLADAKKYLPLFQ